MKPVDVLLKSQLLFFTTGPLFIFKGRKGDLCGYPLAKQAPASAWPGCLGLHSAAALDEWHDLG